MSARIPLTLLAMMRLALTAVLLSACASVDVMGTNAPPHPLYPRLAKDVAIVHTPPTLPYVEVANLRVEGDAGDEDESISMLRDKAAELGCDVLWIQTRQSDDPRLRGICLVYSQVGAAGMAGTAPGSF